MTAIVSFYVYSINLTNPESQELETLIRNAELMSDNILSVGMPSNWTENDVSLIGVIDEGNRVNTEKLSQFKNLADNNYSITRKLLSTRNDYYVFFEDKNNNVMDIDGIDYVGKDINLINPDNLIRIDRFVIYNGTIIKMGIYTW